MAEPSDQAWEPDRDEPEGSQDGAHPARNGSPSDPDATLPGGPPGDTSLIGRTIGRYRILGIIGEGGFGVVYEAEQTEPVRRRVALKVIKPGMDSKSVIARFEAERQALAVMDHPCIAKVFDGGVTDRGHPYFVMELVRGEPITDFCDKHRLTIEQRLELFIKVCDAVQHAHMKGVIHRDIKPSNVLAFYEPGHTPRKGERPAGRKTQGVEGIGVKVIDFGVAKALNQRLSEKTIFTERGVMIGTPEYMSPEQAEMSGVDIDTRTDVYSLGVMLYELLTGMLPFDPEELRSRGFAEIQRIIREVEPLRPSIKIVSTNSNSLKTTDTSALHVRRDNRSLARRLRGELDWIVITSIEKNRDRRYATPVELAQEVRNYLDDKPVKAGPPSFVRRLRRASARSRNAVLVCLTALGAVGAGLVYSHFVGLSYPLIKSDFIYGLVMAVCSIAGLSIYAIVAEGRIRQLREHIITWEHHGKFLHSTQRQSTKFAEYAVVVFVIVAIVAYGLLRSFR